LAEAVIEVSNLSKTYRRGFRRRRVYAVKNLSVTVKAASVVAFVGPNGAGKTTTILTLLGLLKPDAGSIRLFGSPVQTSLLGRIGYQPEIFHTYAFYTAQQALYYYGRLTGLSGNALDEAIPSLLDQVGLVDAADRRTGSFSKGMTQRLGLAQALLHEPELLILDEPTSGLDPEGRRLVLHAKLAPEHCAQELRMFADPGEPGQPDCAWFGRDAHIGRIRGNRSATLFPNDHLTKGLRD